MKLTSTGALSEGSVVYCSTKVTRTTYYMREFVVVYGKPSTAHELGKKRGLRGFNLLYSNGENGSSIYSVGIIVVSDQSELEYVTI